MFGEISGHTGGGRVAEGEQSAAGFHEQAVGMAVVAAFEFYDLVAPRVAACQADGRHGGLGAGAYQPQPLYAGHQTADFLGNYDFSFSGGAERQPAQSRFAHCFQHFRVRVPHDSGSPRADIIDIAFAVFVPHKSALSLFNKARYTAHAAEGAHRRIHAARNHGFGAGEELFVAVGHGKSLRGK